MPVKNWNTKKEKNIKRIEMNNQTNSCPLNGELKKIDINRLETGHVIHILMSGHEMILFFP